MNVMNVPRFYAVRRIVMAAGICAIAATPMIWPTLAGAQTGHALPYILAEGSAGRQGFVRIVNRSARSGTVTITAIDDSGRIRGTESVHLAANGALHFNSRDLERGNPAKGLSGVGSGSRDWRLTLSSALDIQPLAYVRTADGFVTRIDDVEAGSSGNRYTVHFFNPASNRNQRSYLRLINPGGSSARLTLRAHDDTGAQRGPVTLDLPAGQARRLTVDELEAGGSGFTGRLGTGSGKWRLTVNASAPVQVMSLLQTPTGHLTNLSGVPAPSATPPPPSVPDLVVQSPSVGDNTLAAGRSFTLAATVRNQGTGQAAATTLRWYRSGNASISGSDTPAGTDRVGSLAAGASSRESVSLRAPASAGAYYYGGCVDGVSGETDTGNNCSSGVRVTVSAPPTNGPDLTMGTVTFNVYRLIESGLWSAYVHNRGNADSEATTVTVSADGRTAGSERIRPIRTYYPRTFVYGDVATPLPRVGATLRFCVAPVTGETDTTNNCDSYTLLRSPGFDAHGAPTAGDISGPVSQARQAFEARRRELQRLNDHR